MNITAGKYKGRKIEAPDEKIARPTLSKTRMGIFNTLYSIIGDFTGKSFLDVFGGSGIMGLEAISRGFASSVVFEKNKFAADIIKRNYSSLGLNPNLFIGDSEKLIKKFNSFYDVAYIDPPYDSPVYESVISSVNADIIVVEHSRNIDFSQYNVLKTKKYGGSTVTYVKRTH